MCPRRARSAIFTTAPGYKTGPSRAAARCIVRRNERVVKHRQGLGKDMSTCERRNRCCDRFELVCPSPIAEGAHHQNRLYALYSAAHTPPPITTPVGIGSIVGSKLGSELSLGASSTLYQRNADRPTPEFVSYTAAAQTSTQDCQEFMTIRFATTGWRANSVIA